MKKDPREMLMRSMNDSKIGGVCSRLAKFADLDPTIMRLIFVFLAFCDGIGIVMYLIAWLVMPSDEN